MNVIENLSSRFAKVRSLAGSVLILVSACRTVPTLAPFDLAAPGWTLREGQATWRSRTGAPEMTGELLVATHPDGAAFVQLTKNPLPILSAQTTTNRWQIQFHPQNRTCAGSGEPPQRIAWLHLARCVTGGAMLLSDDWRFQRIRGGVWRLANSDTGESIEGFLTPGLPASHTVRSNETLQTMARNYGVELMDLRAANPQLVPGELRAGDTVRLPVP